MSEPFDLAAAVDALLSAGVPVPLFGRLVAALEDSRAELQLTEGDLAVAVREAVTARAELDVFRAELREATKSTLGWRQWVMRGRDEAIAERDEALAAVQNARALADAAEWQAQRWQDPLPVPSWVADLRLALGTVGQPQEDPGGG